MMFTEAEQRALVEIARAAVTEAITGRHVEVARPDTLDRLPPASGAFVTLKRDGQLRGCIGTLECRRPLAEEIARAAVSAAREDPRFDPLRPAELDDLDIEVSVLGPLEAIDPHDAGSIDIGRHGLVVEQGNRRGLLLPQVAPEWGWGREEFLAQTCKKASLPLDAWKRGAAVYRFAADVFGD
jgi:AmmeMemoRadiSam system protein A